MQITKTDYEPGLLEKWQNLVSPEIITELLGSFVRKFDQVIRNVSQRIHFNVYLLGLMSDLERKSIEPIALNLVGQEAVRPMQQFLTRSSFNDDLVLENYQNLVAERLSHPGGMLSTDGSDFPKSGKHSVGVGRQYCGTLGKVENCQAGVFVAYASENGYALLERELYFQDFWFSDEYAEMRKKCCVDCNREFQTKNEIAFEMIQNVTKRQILDINWIGADSAFGSDHGFLDALPREIPYFVAVKSNEKIFLNKNDTRAICVKTLAEDATFKWEKSYIFNGSKGAVYSDTKIIRVFESRTINNKPQPQSVIWVYIRKFENGDIKYFISNALENTPESELHKAATLRWPIEQCFLECKSYLGMGHFEGRTYGGLMRHWLFVMIAHFFATSLRLELKKRDPNNLANGSFVDICCIFW